MERELRKAIASKLKIVRIENNDTMRSLSKKTKLSVSTIFRYEHGKYDMTIDIIAKILNCYNINIAIFFEEVIAKMHSKEQV